MASEKKAAELLYAWSQSTRRSVTAVGYRPSSGLFFEGGGGGEGGGGLRSKGLCTKKGPKIFSLRKINLSHEEFFVDPWGGV